MARILIHDVTVDPQIAADIRQVEVAWQEKKGEMDVSGREPAYLQLIHDLLAAATPKLKGKRYQRIMSAHVKKHSLPWLSKSQVIAVYHTLCEAGWLEHDVESLKRLQMKPTRSQAGVTVVTVLTKPYPCPGKCIFCPTDVRMPKSYLHDEPGAMRAERHAFDPYNQTFHRIQALESIGHPADKIELLILGGTWSSYRRDYQEWFVKRCFEAMNDGLESATLPEAQAINAKGKRRNVGLVVETRPDHITPDELRWLRYLGVTKVQIGLQSMDDHILKINNRGHTVQEAREAIRLLRLGGFKIHAHWMPNLLGGTPEADVVDFSLMWSDVAIRPDELKIYPCMLLDNAELYEYWQRGEYHPYSEEELTELLIACKVQVPRYVRINRVIRDIPTTNVVEGMKKANLRQIAQLRMTKRGLACQCIRCREIRREKVTFEELELRVETYETEGTTEHFLSYERADGRIAGFLRLSCPRPGAPHPLPELTNHAMIREVHVYGPAVPIGEDSQGQAQHIGLGTHLINSAKQLAQTSGYTHLAVISAIGTQNYYAKHNFGLDGLYMTTSLIS